MMNSYKEELNRAFLAEVQKHPQLKIPHETLRKMLLEDPMHDVIEKVKADLGIVVGPDGEVTISENFGPVITTPPCFSPYTGLPHGHPDREKMTAKEWARLKPSEQLIKVAECVGPALGLWQGEILEECKEGDLTRIEYLPDYLNELNAMHEAEKTMSSEQAEQYTQALWIIIKRDHGGVKEKGHWQLWGATAKQKAEAFAIAMTGGS